MGLLLCSAIGPFDKRIDATVILGRKEAARWYIVLARWQNVKPFCSAALPTPKPEASSCGVGYSEVTAQEPSGRVNLKPAWFKLALMGIRSAW